MWEPLDLCKPGPLVGTSAHTLERVMMCMSVRDPGLQSKAQGRLKQFATSPMHRPQPPPPIAPLSDDDACSSGLAVPVGSWPGVMKLVTAHLLVLWSLTLPPPPFGSELPEFRVFM